MDERATLEELERVRQAIEQYKAKRKAAGEEFEQFVRAFKTPGDTPTPPRAATRTPPAETPDVGPPAPSIQTAPDTRDVEPPAPSLPAPTLAEAAPIPDAGQPVRRHTGPTTGVLIGITLAALAGVALAMWTLRPGAPDSPTTSAATPVAAPESPPPAPQAAVATELITVRTVWVRVVADGKRVVERELPPNARVPLTAEKTIVIRTGDAGAIRLFVRGQDKGFLGRAGEVVTRTFAVPPPQAR